MLDVVVLAVPRLARRIPAHCVTHVRGFARPTAPSSNIYILWLDFHGLTAPVSAATP